MLFYAWGEPTFLWILLFSIFVNWALALGIDWVRGKKNSFELERLICKGYLICSISYNIGLLFVFKYLNFSMLQIEK